jgi:hypothetical protein
MPGYYDYVLVLIPLAMLAIVGLLTTFGWSLLTAMPVGAGVSTLVVGHALFVNAPVDTTVRAKDTSVIDSTASRAD